jgi:hypothetical protein
LGLYLCFRVVDPEGVAHSGHVVDGPVRHNVDAWSLFSIGAPYGIQPLVQEGHTSAAAVQVQNPQYLQPVFTRQLPPRQYKSRTLSTCNPFLQGICPQGNTSPEPSVRATCPHKAFAPKAVQVQNSQYLQPIFTSHLPPRQNKSRTLSTCNQSSQGIWPQGSTNPWPSTTAVGLLRHPPQPLRSRIVQNLRHPLPDTPAHVRPPNIGTEP